MIRAPFLLLKLSVATLGQSIFKIQTRGASGDGIRSDTAAIQAAIDACAEAGGGQVLFPPGRHALDQRRATPWAA